VTAERAGVEGRWNGRTQGIGGGGCSGNLGVTSATNAGYVGSGTDGGHVGGDCEPGVNLDGTYNVTVIDDWSPGWPQARDPTLEGDLPTPITGCGHCTIIGTAARRVAARVICSGKSWPMSSMASWRCPGDLLDTVSGTAQMWGQFAMKDLAGGVIPAAKQNFATARATAACDSLDGHCGRHR
jgi:hypothetical protein